MFVCVCLIDLLYKTNLPAKNKIINMCIYSGQLDASRPGNGIEVTGDSLRAAVQQMLNGEKVQPGPPSIGCNIKWKKGNEPQ